MIHTDSYRIRQTEVGTITHNGREFASLGSAVQGRHVAGYLGKDGSLTRWGGEQMLPSNRYTCFSEWTWGEFGDKGEVCGWRVGNGRYVVGWAMDGTGSLFRGELVEADDDDDAKRQAESIADHWVEQDCEERWGDFANEDE